MSTLSYGKTKSPGRRQNRALRFKTRGASLGLAASRTDQLIDQVQGGFSFKTIVSLATVTGIPVSEIASIIGLPERTLARRRAAGKLAPDESERLLRIATVFEKAVNLFEGDVHAAVAWLRKPR